MDFNHNICMTIRGGKCFTALLVARRRCAAVLPPSLCQVSCHKGQVGDLRTRFTRLTARRRAQCSILLRNVQKLQFAPFCSSQLLLALVSSFLALVSSFLALVSSCNLQLALVISSQLLLCSQMKVQTKRESFLNNAFTYAASSQLCYQQV